MSLTERGRSLSDDLVNLGRDVWDWGDNGLVIRRSFKTTYERWLANLIVKGSAHPEVPQCTLRRVQVVQRPDKLAKLCQVNLIYRQDSPLGTEENLAPTDRYTDNSDAVRVSILDSPYFASLHPVDGYDSDNRTMEYVRAWMETNDDAKLLAALASVEGEALDLLNELIGHIAKGRTEVYASNFTVTKTEFSANEFDAPTGRTARREDPGGGYGDSGQWLILGCYRGKEGPWHTRNTVYQHSDEAVPTYYPEV